MKSFFKNWNFKKHFYFCLGLTIFFLWLFKYIFVLSLFLSTLKNHPQSIGIIGGADGPTAIYLASSTSSFITYFCILFLIGLVSYIPLKKHLLNRY